MALLEQITGGTTSPASDIFSTGVTLYEMITGDCPFLGSNAAESMQNILNLHPAAPTEVRSDVPQWFSDMVRSMLEKESKNRYQSIQDLLEKYSFQKDEIDSRSLADMINKPVQSAK